MLVENLNYDPATGIFEWRISGRGRKRKRAGFVNPDGYRRISIGKKNYLEHRLAWLIVHGVWPRNEIDHINGVRDDNRIENLREATKAQNQQNSRLRSDNTSGLKGVHSYAPGIWRALIYVRGQHICLGMFPSKQDAHAAYCAAATQYFGEFANPGRSQVWAGR